MSKIEIVCSHCGKPSPKEVGAVNRARNRGLHVFCSRRCFGLHRRTSVEQKKRQKAGYDARRRVELREEIRAEKRAYHQRTYDPVTAREHRKTRTFDHTAYCRRYYADPAKKQEKIAYDIRRRGAAYANYAEAWRLLIALEREIRKRVPDKYERQKGRGYFTKINERKRNDRQERRIA